MRRTLAIWGGVLGGVGLLLMVSSWIDLGGDRVDYNTNVKPILNKHCLACHGGVKKAGEVSFLFEEEMMRQGKSGKFPVVRGDASASEMIRRIETDDPDEKMPKDGPPLTSEEVATLRKWIDEGAVWGKHWAYQRIERPDIPTVSSIWARLGLWKDEATRFVQNPVDNFVFEKLKKKGLTPSPEADRATLIRRLSLDLTGLPPSADEVQAFVNDPSPSAYEALVDRLLASPAFGERWAAMWLDLARYADTKGYERDPGRSIWRFRDYVIQSFNTDKPFDQFTIEQLAGDLLPAAKEGLPSEEALIATGFHRNTMTNDEGGTEDEEFRVAAVIDRVNTTWEVWQGTTFACIQCHSHPYDPIRHEEYFKYMAFFNNTRDEDVTTETPTLRFYEKEDSVRLVRVKQWITQQSSSGGEEHLRFLRIVEPKINSHDFDQYRNASLLDAKFFGAQHQGSGRIVSVNLSGQQWMLLNTSTGAAEARMTVWLDSLGKQKIAEFKVPPRDTVLVVPLPAIQGKRHLYLYVHNPTEPKKWVSVRWVAFQKALPGQGQPGYQPMVEAYANLLTGGVKNTPIFWEGTGDLARKTHVFERGNWLVKGEEVQPDVPLEVLPFPAQLPRNRLGLAKWTIHRDNPLTARVMVNRFWEQLFGKGIVETVEDFGSQGAAPTHPELLDWLAVEWMEKQGWSVKKLLKTLVMSGTYRQKSQVNKTLLEKDPYNDWYARGPRVRLSAEQVRDQALSVSQLLSQKRYGPGVMPPQPEGIWLSPYSGESWRVSEGEDRYRRAVYTYWKRTAPYPSMVTFDAPSREFCQSRRIRTNTPLQALVTLNDPVYLEAAQRLAERMLRKSSDPDAQLAEGYWLLTYQPIDPKSLAILRKVYQEARTEFALKPSQMDQLLNYGSRKSPDLAALTVSANVLLNLDKVVTKE